MKLSVFPRPSNRKSDVKSLRRQGHVPGVLYGVNRENQNISFSLDELRGVLRQIRPGLLATTVFELQVDGKAYKALAKEVQYHPATYAILHADFVVLSDNEPVHVNVPIQVLGVSDCVGIKLGGFMRQVIRSLKVKCLPSDIPQEFTVDVRDMNVADSKRLSDISIPANVRPLAKMNEVAVVIAKKA